MFELLLDKDGDRDGIPNVLLEAMAMEIPVVSTAISGIVELIEDRKTGLLIQQKDPQALANALEELINNPELRQQLKVAGRAKVVAQFSLEENVKEIKHLLVNAWEESLTNNQSSVSLLKEKFSSNEV
ncbi:MAG: glycosyltransferase [Xenococcaceae cyanobacterium MO_167.B27]|nr:glycosyltransferase [Xenococcaceae cyanobacterium MO_167.B27]